MSPEMRIIGGCMKGRKIITPSGEYRPTTGITKKSLFDTLGTDVEGSDFLDLFAGAGGIGIEALSRGAGNVVFIESHFPRTMILGKNLERLGIQKSSYEIIGLDYAAALDLLRGKKRIFDIIYVDPPYQSIHPRRILGNIVTARVLAPDGFLIYEVARLETRETLDATPDELYPVKERAHGGTTLIFFRWREAAKHGFFDE